MALSFMMINMKLPDLVVNNLMAFEYRIALYFPMVPKYEYAPALTKGPKWSLHSLFTPAFYNLSTFTLVSFDQ